MNRKPNKNIEALQQAVEGLHGCKAKYKEKTHVIEKFKGDMVWEGDVYLFELKNHPTAKLAYAWSSVIEGSKKRRFFAVLHSKPVESAQDAVRAAIVSEYTGK
jgi:ribosomal 50S subunit-associated protein YjgA (DUF615 family)